MLGFFKKPDLGKLEAGDRIKADVRRILSIDEDVTVSVNEIECGDPACPGGIETVILIRHKGQPMRAAKVPGGFEYATPEALQKALGVV